MAAVVTVPVQIAHLDNCSSPVQRISSLTWSELAELVTFHQSGPKDGGAWMPAAIEPGPRLGVRVRSITALVLDVEAAAEKQPDGAKHVTGPLPPPLQGLAAELELQGWKALLATSHSHQEPTADGGTLGPRYRAVFPLSRSLQPHELRSLGLHVAALLGIQNCIDVKCLEPARLFYLPRCPAKRMHLAECAQVEGAPLDVDALLRAATAAQTPPRITTVPRATAGVIEAFNAAHDIGTILERHGYMHKDRNRWLWPGSTTGVPGVVVLPDSGRIFSHHGGDPLTGAHGHDAFSAWCILEHGGNTGDAVRAAAQLLDLRHDAGSLPVHSIATPINQGSDRGSARWLDARDGTVDTQPLSELGNARRLAALHGECLRYVPEVGGWLVWMDGAWQWSADGAAVRALAAQLPEVIYAEGALHVEDGEYFARWARASQKAQVITAAVKLLADLPGSRLSLARIDADPWFCGIDGGSKVVDLRTGLVKAAKPSDFVTKSLGVERVGNSNAALRWRQFLAQVCQNDVELLDWIQRWCGYLLSGSTREQVLVFCFGHGANGKSVFAEVLRFILADYARTVANETLCDSKRGAGAPSPDLAGLVGARLALTTETEDGAALAESLVKTLTAGDALSVRPLYKAPFDFVPAFKLLMLGNHRPVIRGTDLGIWRRMRLVPFSRTFAPEERDPELADKLKAEAPHILAWMLDGCAEWLRRGLSDVPRIVAEQTEDYRQEQDTLGQWLGERCTTGPAAEEAGGELYQDYRLWADGCGLRPMSAQAFGRRLTERGFGDRKSHGARIRVGLALRKRAASINAYTRAKA